MLSCYAFINDFETNINTKISKLNKEFIQLKIVDYISFYPTFHLDSTSKIASPKSSLLESKGNGRIQHSLYFLIGRSMRSDLIDYEEGYSSLGGTYVLKNSFQSESHSDSDEDSCCLVLDLV